MFIHSWSQMATETSGWFSLSGLERSEVPDPVKVAELKEGKPGQKGIQSTLSSCRKSGITAGLYYRDLLKCYL